MEATDDSFAGIRRGVNLQIRQVLADRTSELVNTAARYVAEPGGHRWRAIVANLSGRMFPNENPDTLPRLGVAIELFHTASLVLDDLPSMDNASIRRDQPCVHTCFPRWTVDLLPSYLITLGYELLLTLPGVESRYVNSVARRAADVAQSMTRGQELDIAPDRRDLMALKECHRLKTGMLYGFAACAPAMLAGAPEEIVETLERFGIRLGLLYQLDDDRSDFDDDPILTGKDGGNGPPDALAALPRDAIFQLRDELHHDAERQLDLLPFDTRSLGNLLATLSVRQ